AFAQVWGFGAMAILTAPATGLSPAEGGFTITLADGSALRCRTVVIATGVSYRRLDAPGVDRLVGAGVYYGAAASEAPALAGQRVFVAGGANSAGQAAVYLARHARQVTLVVRRDSIAATMSQYLIDEIAGTANIDIRTGTDVAGAAGDVRLESVELRHRITGAVESVPAGGLFVLIGAEPFTDWLPAEVLRDERGFVLTGDDLRTGRSARPFETSLPGVFAAGDVRPG